MSQDVEILSYPPAKRRDYLLMIAAVVGADSKLHPDELALLQRWILEFKLPSRYRKQVLDAAYQPAVDLERVERRLSRTDLTYSLLLDMMGMAMADGVLKDHERRLIKSVANKLNVDPIHFNILIEFVHSAHQASFLSSPEPLYEHNIESAFALLRKQGVRLFAHTLFCATSNDFDQQLKTRWFAKNSL